MTADKLHDLAPGAIGATEHNGQENCRGNDQDAEKVGFQHVRGRLGSRYQHNGQAVDCFIKAGTYPVSLPPPLDSDLTQFNKVFQLSGHHLNDFGAYHKCVDDPTMNYFFVEPGSMTTKLSQGYFGFCLPEPCTKDFIADTLNPIL